jgi:hypothetical protein
MGVLLQERLCRLRETRDNWRATCTQFMRHISQKYRGEPLARLADIDLPRDLSDRMRGPRSSIESYEC